MTTKKYTINDAGITMIKEKGKRDQVPIFFPPYTIRIPP
jgi:hypothetical protein